MRKWLAGLLFIVSVVLLTISIYFLMGMFLQERQDNQLQHQLQEMLQEKSDEIGEDSSGDSLAQIDAGILALHEENPDCIGWITIDGTRIDYPVMYRPGDKNYYLHRDFNGEYSVNGCLYLAEECVPGDSDNLIIYGHHMNSGKMFADLEKYKDEDFYKEHPMIQFRTIWGNEEYEILAAFTTPVYTGNDFNYYNFIKAQKGEDYEYFIREIKRKGIYETKVTACYGEKLLTLSTCEYSQKNGRMVVVAKKWKELGDNDMTDKEIEKESGYEDMEEDWDDDLSEVIDIKEENDYYEDDDLDYGECDYEDELNVQETELPKGKKKYDSILDWDREDYWAYGCSAKKLLEMQFADMMSIAGLLEVVDSLILIGETQQHELQGNVSDISTKLKNRAISIVDRWENFLDKDYEIRR